MSAEQIPTDLPTTDQIVSNMRARLAELDRAEARFRVWADAACYACAALSFVVLALAWWGAL
jgi:hypothetical protein